ncbi:MAG: FAD-binding oxidoreductase [Thermomicrobiales bacterium]|nr:FAD-binding oxidoreductase [Thermomicrobiales bacterium]
MNATVELDRGAIARLRASIDEVIVPGDAGYDAARSVWNGMIDRRPAAIARCGSTADVVEAVRFARDQGLPIAIRGGGHNAAGLAVCDDGLVIDLTRMRRVEVDPSARVARAEGGATWGDLDQATQAHGLATTGGAISMTGVGGLTLGGGLGYLMRSYGLACDNLLAAEIVTATGDVVRADADHDADLLWALKGGGGNFGVVTSFEFRLHPVGDVLGGMLIHPVERAPEVLRFYREFAANAPDEAIVFAALLHTPDGMPAVAIVAAYNGAIAEGERVLKPLRDFGPPVADLIAPIPYTGLQTMLDAGFPSGLPVYWRSHFLTDIDDDLLDTLIARFKTSPSPLSALLIEQLGGQVARVPRDATAFDHRDADFNLAIIARWPDPAMADACIAWARETWDATKGHARGVYVNYLGVGEAGDRVRAAYGEEKYARLAEIKRRYDPDNIFCFNQNIKPAG